MPAHVLTPDEPGYVNPDDWRETGLLVKGLEPEVENAALYVHQGEWASVSAGDAVTHVGTDDGTSCHTVALLTADCKHASIGHVDSAATAAWMVPAMAEALRARSVDDDAAILAYVSGGLADAQSRDLTEAILGVFGASSTTYEVRLLCTCGANVADEAPAIPVTTGMCVSFEHAAGATVWSCMFEDLARGPAFALRYARFLCAVTGPATHAPCYDRTLDHVLVPPMTPRCPERLVRQLMSRSDQELLADFSTTPRSEQGRFASDLRLGLAAQLELFSRTPPKWRYQRCPIATPRFLARRIGTPGDGGREPYVRGLLEILGYVDDGPVILQRFSFTALATIERLVKDGLCATLGEAVVESPTYGSLLLLDALTHSDAAQEGPPKLSSCPGLLKSLLSVLSAEDSEARTCAANILAILALDEAVAVFVVDSGGMQHATDMTLMEDMDASICGAGLLWQLMSSMDAESDELIVLESIPTLILSAIPHLAVLMRSGNAKAVEHAAGVLINVFNFDDRIEELVEELGIVHVALEALELFVGDVSAVPLENLAGLIENLSDDYLAADIDPDRRLKDCLLLGRVIALHADNKEACTHVFTFFSDIFELGRFELADGTVRFRPDGIFKVEDHEDHRVSLEDFYCHTSAVMSLLPAAGAYLKHLVRTTLDDFEQHDSDVWMSPLHFLSGILESCDRPDSAGFLAREFVASGIVQSCHMILNHDPGDTDEIHHTAAFVVHWLALRGGHCVNDYAAAGGFQALACIDISSYLGVESVYRGLLAGAALPSVLLERFSRANHSAAWRLHTLRERRPGQRVAVRAVRRHLDHARSQAGAALDLAEAGPLRAAQDFWVAVDALPDGVFELVFEGV